MKKYLKYILCLAVVLIAGIITCSCQSKYGVCRIRKRYRIYE